MGRGWVGWDLCAGLFYEHRFAMLIICCESNLRSFGICRENNLRTFGTNVANKFTHFVQKDFARKILPTGNLGLFRPLVIPWICVPISKSQVICQSKKNVFLHFLLSL